ncbi:MAG: hypothetical protein ACTSQI_00865 [Candidatus Helarchaeota archaeon]
MKPLLIDVGSFAIKVGFGGEFTPRLDIPLVFGKVRDDLGFMVRRRIFKELGIMKTTQEYFLGAEALFLRNFLELTWISDGKAITDEFFFKKLFENALDSLKIKFTNQPILISQPFYTDIVEYIGQLLFSSYNAYEIIPAFQPLLNYLAGGLQTGIVVDLGHQITQITPMINGTIITDGVRVLNIGGKVVTDVLLELLMEKNAFDHLKESAMLSKWAIADTVKELYCYVSRDPEEELGGSREKSVEITFPLLGGEAIQVGVERFLASEMLFMHQKADTLPIHEVIYEIVSKYDPPYQQALLGNILLTGGTSLLPGLSERLYEELTRKFLDANYKIKIHAFAQFGNPRYSSFFGAAKFTASEEIDSALKISRMDYEYKGKIQISTSFMEKFPAIFEQCAEIKLKPIIISVKNFPHSPLLQRIYNAVNSQRETSLMALSAVLRRSPVELYEALDTLLSYNILDGEFEGYNFINSQYKEEVEQTPPVEAEVPEQKPQIPPSQVEEESYTPSFQRLDAQMPDQLQPQQLRPRPKAEEYIPTFKQLDTQIPDQLPSQKPRPQRGSEEYVPTFEQLDELMPDQLEIKKPVHHDVKEEPEEAPEKQYEFTFQKIDEKMKEEWEKDETVVTGEVKSARDKLKAMLATGPSYLKAEEEKKKEWEESGLVLTPKPVEPKGFFDQIAIPAEPSEESLTFTKVEKEKAAEWAEDETIITEKVESARDKLKAMLATGPSYVKAEDEKKKEWEESGLISMPKRPMPKGFFQQPTLPSQDDNIPTFLKIKDQEIPQPKKVMIADLLQPKTELIRPGVQQKSSIPTFLEGSDLTEEQLQQLRLFEEEERKKKEKEEKLL